MQGYDILMLGVMAIAIMRGYSKGLAWQISSIASIVASYFVAYRFKGRLAPHIELADPWRGLVAMMLLFVGTSLVIWFIFQRIRGGIEKAKLKDFDHQLGAIFGGVQGAAVCTAITIVALSFLAPGMSQTIVNSRSGGYIARLVSNSKVIIPQEVQQVVQPYIRRAEQQLQDRIEQPGDSVVEDWFPTDSWEDRSGAVLPSQPPAQQPQPFQPPVGSTDDSWFYNRNSGQDPLGEFSNSENTDRRFE